MTHQQLFPGCFIEIGCHGAYRHSFGGAHSTVGALCPNCDRPLMLYLTIDMRDRLLVFPSGRPELRTIQLFYCMRCALAWHDFAYQLISDGTVEIVEAHRGPRTWDDWGEAVGCDVFPVRPVSLTPIPARLQELWDRLNGLELGETLSIGEAEEVIALTQGHAFPPLPGMAKYSFVNQIGGRALLCQGIDDPPCPRCGGGPFGSRQMLFLACLYNDAENRLRIASVECTQIIFFLCPECFTVLVLSRL